MDKNAPPDKSEVNIEVFKNTLMKGKNKNMINNLLKFLETVLNKTKIKKNKILAIKIPRIPCDATPSVAQKFAFAFIFSFQNSDPIIYPSSF